MTRSADSRSSGSAAAASALPTAYPSAVPVLTDGVVTLRALRRKDADLLVELANDEEVLRWTTIPRPYRKADGLRRVAAVREMWEDPHADRVWAIDWTDTEGTTRFAGQVDLRPRAGRTAEIGYVLHPAARGEGIMARAVRLVAQHGFAEGIGSGPLTRIHWSAVVGNFPSRRVAWACGFAFHGTIPQSGPGYPGPDGEVVVRDHWYASLSPHAAMVPATAWLDIPVLEANGIRLRPWRDGDADTTEPLANPSHHMPLGSAPDDLTFEHWLLVRRERAAAGEGIAWCIADERTDAALGAVMVFAHGAPISEPGAEIGYFLYPSARGRGVATAAGDLAVEYAFTPRHEGGLGLSRLSAITASDNIASNSVLERLGFVRWGVEHATDRLPDGTWADAYHWELLREHR
ncbi:Acetyltransferase [Nostocoides japonicum T1-X7]|uniref:Acetyltransferase n=1 Tax=Nostocoides japonicum T1-X7 TaxID=1194083 RepID=A0A077LSY4_9MICO|nr:GNAT family N-acetyltransferase [Tetrasphaera japonica]CCH76021.1 Acetyltransferase [Tetrasphaera japonica T1-X7]